MGLVHFNRLIEYINIVSRRRGNEKEEAGKARVRRAYHSGKK
jgi:hypothetical protein